MKPELIMLFGYISILVVIWGGIFYINARKSKTYTEIKANQFHYVQCHRLKQPHKWRWEEHKDPVSLSSIHFIRCQKCGMRPSLLDDTGF